VSGQTARFHGCARGIPNIDFVESAILHEVHSRQDIALDIDAGRDLRNESRRRVIVSDEMTRHQTAIKSVVLGLAALSLSACASGRTAGEHIADMPHWMGGLPADTPPRRSSPEFDEWMAKRAQEAARPKLEQQPK